MLTANQTLDNLSNLTQSQLWIWAGQQLSPDAPLYNSPFTFEMDGEIDAAHFQTAFQWLIDHSDAMRTVFELVDDIPQAKVLDSISYHVECLDFSNESDAAQHFQSWVGERVKYKFDLSQPLFDSVLIQMPGNKTVWYFNQHHLICDAPGVPVQYKALIKVYEHLSAGKSISDINIPPFHDYVVYEKKSRQLLKDSPVKSYWEEQLQAVPSTLKLYGRSADQETTLSKRVAVTLSPQRTQKLLALTKEKDFRLLNAQLSLFNIFATVLSAYLSRISNEKNNLVFGTPVQHRITPAFKETPGIFIEFFPFTCTVKDDDSFTSLFKRISTKTYDFLRNAKPGASTPQLNRAFNVILNFINTAFPDFNGQACEATWHHPDHTDPGHHLRLHVYNDSHAERIQLYFDLNAAVFSEQMHTTVTDHFLKLLDAFIENPGQSLALVDLLSKKEFQEIIVDFNKQEHAVHKSVLDLFRLQVQQHGQQKAVTDKTQTLSYAELYERSNQLANYLIQQGIASGKRVAIYLNRSADLIVSMLAVFKAGCAYVPIASNNPLSRVIDRINESGAAIILTDSDKAANLKDLRVACLRMDADYHLFATQEKTDSKVTAQPDALAYIMFTSGSTGKPKGVQISQRALANYIGWARKEYSADEHTVFPLFTTIDFDLTVTSIFVPLISGSAIVVYEESSTGPDLSIFDVMDDNQATIIKLTPSHLGLIKDHDFKSSHLKTMIVGGENFGSDLAQTISQSFGHNIKIYNEYGPTEATVGCIVHLFDADSDSLKPVPIGKPITNMQAYILDEALLPVPQGVAGKLFVAGVGLSEGYWENEALTAQKFLDNPFEPNTKIYDTGDLARLNEDGVLEYLGRKDQQVKIGGIRIELGEIESVLAKHEAIKACVAEVFDNKKTVMTEPVINCIRCGLPSNYPTATFNEQGVCNYCLSFEHYKHNAEKYFKQPAEFKHLLDTAKRNKEGQYDCLMLLSGGKDSTYALAQLVAMGARVLTYTLDNGYISDSAKANIRRVVSVLGVDHMFGTTPAMNEIFVESLHKFSNVCNGCFKTIYTLSTKVAFEKKIPFIVTGLSRGQFFETRLTEELFLKDDVANIDKTILEARKSYHRVDDAVKRLLDTSVFDEDAIFEKVQFLDFYRYFDVEFSEMMRYLDKHLPWVRPTDTGRSTNCLINQVGIFIHKKDQGYSNYAFPYSWDVRMGHKTRAVSLDEINEEIDEGEVKKILGEIGYTAKTGAADKNLVLFYIADTDLSTADLRAHLKSELPDYMIPNQFKRVESFPLTPNGKVDRAALQNMASIAKEESAGYVAPETEFEVLIAGIWSEVLQVEQISLHDNFLELGGNSLAAIRITSRINNTFDLTLPVNIVFENATIAQLASHIEQSISMMLEDLNT